MNLESPWAAWISSWTSGTSQQHHKQKLKNASSSESMCPVIPCSIAGVSCAMGFVYQLHPIHGACITNYLFRHTTNKQDRWESWSGEGGVFLQSCFNLKVKQLCPASPPFGANRKANILLSYYCRNAKGSARCQYVYITSSNVKLDVISGGSDDELTCVHLWNCSFSFEQTVRNHFVVSSFGKHGESYYDKSMSFPQKVHSTSSQLSTHRLSNRNRDPRVACQDTRVPDLLQVAVNLWPYLFGARMCDLQRYMNRCEYYPVLETFCRKYWSQ